MTTYSDAVAAAKARLGITGPVEKDQPGGVDVHVETDLGEGASAGGRRRARTFSEIIAEETAGVDGEGAQNGKPAGQAKAMGDLTSKRDLQPNDDDTCKTPFLYDAGALGSLRPDQVPRFFGALTDPHDLPLAEVNLDELVAMQDRVDPDKVDAIRGNWTPDSNKLPVVVAHNAKLYIADGHHRLAAQYLDGADTARVRFKDLTERSNALKRDNMPIVRKHDDGTFDIYSPVTKVDSKLGLVFGWAIVCKENGAEYWDVQDNHIPEDAMLKAVFKFAKGSRPGKVMHEGQDLGQYLFLFPVTEDIAKAMGIQTDKTGLMVGFAPPKSVLKRFESGELAGFSIGGEHIKLEDR